MSVLTSGQTCIATKRRATVESGEVAPDAPYRLVSVAPRTTPKQGASTRNTSRVTTQSPSVAGALPVRLGNPVPAPCLTTAINGNNEARARARRTAAHGRPCLTAVLASRVPRLAGQRAVVRHLEGHDGPPGEAPRIGRRPIVVTRVRAKVDGQQKGPHGPVGPSPTRRLPTHVVVDAKAKGLPTETSPIRVVPTKRLAKPPTSETAPVLAATFNVLQARPRPAVAGQGPITTTLGSHP